MKALVWMLSCWDMMCMGGVEDDRFPGVMQAISETPARRRDGEAAALPVTEALRNA